MNTGWKRYQYLIEVYEDNGSPTGNIKTNELSDDDYVSDIWSPNSCPYPGMPITGSTVNTGSTVITIPQVFTLNYGVNNSAAGTISIYPQNNSNEYLEGQTATLIATSNSGYLFTQFQGVNGNVSADTQHTYISFVMDSDKTVTAYFVPEKRRITVEPGGGGISVKINANPTVLYSGVYEFDYGSVITIIGSVIDQDLSTCGVITDEWGNQISGGCAVLGGDPNMAYLNSSPILTNSNFTLLNNVTLRGALYCDTSNCF